MLSLIRDKFQEYQKGEVSSHLISQRNNEIKQFTKMLRITPSSKMLLFIEFCFSVLLLRCCIYIGSQTLLALVRGHYPKIATVLGHGDIFNKTSFRMGRGLKLKLKFPLSMQYLYYLFVTFCKTSEFLVIKIPAKKTVISWKWFLMFKVNELRIVSRRVIIQARNPEY